MELQLHAVENDASVIEQFYKPKQKQFVKFEFDYNPLTDSQNIVITSYFWYDPLIFDLMTPTSTQFIGSAKNIHILSLMVIHTSVLMIMWSQAIFAYIMSPTTFEVDLMTPKSVQFIASARYILFRSFIVLCSSVLMIMWSQAIFAYIISPVTFDLWPCDPKSIQLIGSTRYILDLSRAGIH